MTSIIDVLLVEDDPNDLELAMRAFNLCAVVGKTHHVRDGNEALDFLFARGKYASRAGLPGPKLVFLDLKLPAVSGTEVLRQIKEDPETREIPVVVLSSSTHSRDVDACYQLHANSYIVKSIDFEEFAASIASATSYWLITNKLPGMAGYRPLSLRQ